MTAQSSPPPPNSTRERPPSDSSAQQPPPRPWRTEGLPKEQPPKPRRRSITAAIWLVAYLVLFGLLTVQDRRSGPQPVPYTEFKSQVADKNIAELFVRGDSIEGQLKKAVPLPGQQNRTYQQFTTERPTFASDDDDAHRIANRLVDSVMRLGSPLTCKRGAVEIIDSHQVIVKFAGTRLARSRYLFAALLSG
jgi:FtsH Extracellular